MKVVLALSLIILMVLIGCETKPAKLFWISEPKGYENDFIFMAESTNVSKIKSDSLVYFITKEEFTLKECLIFKDFGKIHSDDHFDVHILYKEVIQGERDYTFMIRIFDKAFKIIDTYELTVWNALEHRFCFGKINENLRIIKHCVGNEIIEIRQIGGDGRIVSVDIN